MSENRPFPKSRIIHALSHCKLCRQVTGAVFLAILVVEAAILIFSVNSFERDRLNELQREGLAVVRSWMQISGDDPRDLSKMAPMIGNGSVLISALVYDSAGNEVAGLVKNSIMPTSTLETFQVEWMPNDIGYPYRVVAKLDKSELDEQITSFVWRIMGLVLIISIFVTLVTMIILENKLLSPIRMLRKRMVDACMDPSHPEMHVQGKMRDDEIGDVTRAFNELLTRLSHAFTEIRTQQQTLVDSNEQLEQMVHERTQELQTVVRDLRREATERERAEQALDASKEGLAAEHLKRLAYTDTLTGLANRDLFMDRCEQVLRQVSRIGGKAAVLLLDIKGFSAINEQFGQQGGDEILQRVGERLKTLVRDSDTLARLSSDEFAIIQLDINQSDEAAMFAERIFRRLSAPFDYKGEELELSFAVGISMMPMEDECAEEVINHAHLAHKRAKQDQGSSYHFYVEEMDAQIRERQQIERDLKLAISKGELRVFYQPKLDLRTHKISGMEALVRWDHPTRGFMSPGLFIPIAERGPLIIGIGEWVLREAATQARLWQTEGLGNFKIAVNVSAMQLKETDMVTLVRQVLLETGLPAELLELELTESAIMEDVDHVIEVLEGLRKLGVSLSIDDFGTGYSSLNYLKRFPVKRIKIDKAFVDEIQNERSEGVIARAVITMGHSMGMEITAEGVEHPFQQAFLEAHGCDEIQGYLFARPMNAQNVEQFIKEGGNPAVAAE